MDDRANHTNYTLKMKNWNLFPVTDYIKYTEGWNKLNSEGPKTALLDSDFVSPLLEQFATENDRLAICGDTENPAAMTLIAKTKTGVWATLQPSQSPFGLWLHKKEAPLEELLQSLAKSLPFPTILLGITQQDPDVIRRPEESDHLTTLDYIKTARVTLNGSFDDYWSKRGKNLRQNLRRQRNRLHRENVDVTLNVISKPGEIKDAIRKYGELESAGWKNDLGTAIHIDNAQGKFYCKMLENFCNKEQGIVFQYLYNNKLVATDLCIKDSSSLIILKTTYDEEIKTSSPAMLMRQGSFEYIFNKKLVDRIEFYGKVMDWHTKWSDEIRTIYHINYFLLSFLNKFISKSSQ